jgi:hypothetical protein
LTRAVIKALGDKLISLLTTPTFAWTIRSGTPSTGPLGGGPSGGAVTGIGATQRSLRAIAAPADFQWQFIQPVYAGSNQMQQYPPDGITDSNNHKYCYHANSRCARLIVRFRLHAMSQIDMMATAGRLSSAKVNGETILSAPHTGPEVSSPCRFLISAYRGVGDGRRVGDNYDGTTLSLMTTTTCRNRLVFSIYTSWVATPAEVPDFLFSGISFPPADRNGHPIFERSRQGDHQRCDCREGRHMPDVDHSRSSLIPGSSSSLSTEKTE